MNGNQMGTLAVLLSVNQGAWTQVWSFSNSQGSNWQSATVSLPAGADVRIMFRGTVSNGPRGDMAIDAISIGETGNAVANMAPPTISSGITVSDLIPNPANSYVEFNVSSPNVVNAKIFILDAAGKRYNMGTTHLSEGQNSVTLYLNELPSGVYLMVVDDGATPQSKRFVVVKE
jgi:hypothetical protein